MHVLLFFTTLPLVNIIIRDGEIVFSLKKFVVVRVLCKAAESFEDKECRLHSSALKLHRFVDLCASFVVFTHGV